MKRTEMLNCGPHYQRVGEPVLSLDMAIEILLESHARLRDEIVTLETFPFFGVCGGGATFSEHDYTRAWLTLWNYRELRRFG